MMAIILGRFLEMMVGVARISDLTVLWVVFGLFAASANFDDHSEVTAATDERQQTPRNVGRRDAKRSRRASTSQTLSTGLVLRLAVVVWLVGGIGVVTWQKSINYVRAAVHEGRALSSFQTGDLETAVVELDKAIKLAPGVPSRYNNRAQVFLAYQIRSDVDREPECHLQNENPYFVCLGLQSLQSNMESANQQPFNFRAQVAAGNSAFALRLHQAAIDYYTKATGLLPEGWGLRNNLAESQIDAGLFDEALAQLDRSMLVTGEAGASARALFLRGKALNQLGRLEEARANLERGIQYGYKLPWTQESLNLRKEIDEQLGVQYHIAYFDRKISKSPEDAVDLYLRGLAKLRIGETEAARIDVAKSYGLGLELSEVLAMSGYTRFKAGVPLSELNQLDAAILASPQNALIHVYLG
ncbi:MAG: tetratricopeptide repeat protein, partial [Opitutales bacterium]